MRSQQTVMKMFNIAHIVSKVLMVIMFVVSGLSMFSGLMMVIFSSTDVMKEALVSSVGELGFDLTAFEVGIVTIVEGVVMLAEGLLFMYARNYFRGGLADGTPFTYRGADELKALGIKTIALPLGATVIGYIVCFVCGVDWELSASIDIGLGVALILLSYVLCHGADIKAKADRASSTDNNDNSFEIHNLFD